MIQWYEGIVTKLEKSGPGEPDQGFHVTAISADGSIQASKIQIPIKNSYQEQLQIGSKILFYRDSSATAKFVSLLSDPPPIASPINRSTFFEDILSGEDTFEPGEIAIQAKGKPDDFIPVDGGLLWVKNCGDITLYSGDYAQSVSVNESTNGVTISGNTIDLTLTGTLALTHGITLESNDIGSSGLSLGQRDTLTGSYLSSLKISSLGSIRLGLTEPLTELLVGPIVPGVLLSGISYDPTPTITAPLGPQITLRSVPVFSEITVNTLGTTIWGPIIGVVGEVSLSMYAPTVVVGGGAVTTNAAAGTAINSGAGLAINSGVSTVISSGVSNIINGITNFINGITNISGATTINGATIVNGAFAVNPAFTGTFKTGDPSPKTVTVVAGIIMTVT